MFSGCAKDQPADTAAGELTVEKVAVIEGLDLPECMVIDPNSGKVYVSNVVTANEGYWVDDSNGFISLMSPDGKIEKLRWLDSSFGTPVNNPKGMCILDGKLYFNDNDKLKHCSLKAPSETGIIAFPEAQKLNDLATDGKSIWVTDTGASKVFCIGPDGRVRQIQSPDTINGITSYKGKLFAVSWGRHEIYELDPDGEEAPVAFGLASHFTALDGIEVLDDGTFIVSDYKGNKLCSVSADRKTVRTLIELETPADFWLDRQNMLLYVPEMMSSRAVILKLKM
jgi:sugar lactone lactonase YvrE